MLFVLQELTETLQTTTVLPVHLIVLRVTLQLASVVSLGTITMMALALGVEEDVRLAMMALHVIFVRLVIQKSLFLRIVKELL